MVGSFFAEALKLRKRPAVWTMGILWLAVVILFLYLLPGLVFAVTTANARPEVEATLQEQLFALTPGNLAAYLLQFFFPGLGTAVAIILGALTAGSEYSWGTLTIVLSQHSGRLGVLAGKLLALCVLLFIFVLVAFLIGGLSSLVVALLSGASPAPPPVIELLESSGSGMLILVLWAVFGFMLATLFRGTALAVGLGLIYAFAIEPAFAGLFAISESLNTVVDFLPGVNTSALPLALIDTGSTLGFEEVLLEPTRSILVMLLYIVLFVLISALVFRQRDVTT